MNLKRKKLYISLISVFLIVVAVLIVHYINGFKNVGNKIVVEKQAGKANTYEDFNEIKNGNEVQKVKDILENVKWEKSDESMKHPCDYKFHFDYLYEEHKSSGLVYELWISPNKDKVELVMEDKRRYIQLNKEKSEELFRIIAGKKLSEANILLPDSKPKDFNFIFNFGVGAKNQLDTVKGQYTRDMISEPSITAELKLTEEEMNSIYSKMKKLDILNYPDKFTPKSRMCATPFDTYSMKIIINGKEKNIYWEDENVSKTKGAVQLRDLFTEIYKIIMDKEEFKKLPKPKGGYM